MRFLRSPFFFKPAKTILVPEKSFIRHLKVKSRSNKGQNLPGIIFFGLTRYLSKTSEVQTIPESKIDGYLLNLPWRDYLCWRRSKRSQRFDRQYAR